MPTPMHMPQTPVSEGPRTDQSDWLPPPPPIEDDESLITLCNDLSIYFIDVIHAPHTFEQLRTASVGHILKPLITSLSDGCHHLEVVSALLILKWHFGNMESDDGGIWEARGHACEIVAWRFLTHLSEKEAIDYLLHELPGPDGLSDNSSEADDNVESGYSRSIGDGNQADEHSPLLRNHLGATKRPGLRQFEHRGQKQQADLIEEDPTVSFVGLNTLEIAAIANAKKFLSQKIVQKIVNDIWSGNIVFWDTLSVSTNKHAQIYNKRKADPYCRLRVPKYQKVFESLFFATFLVLYYAVLVERNPRTITPIEILLYIWIAAFACDEFGEFRDAGTLFYAADFWSLWDIIVIAIGFAFFISRIVGLSKDSDRIVDISFDILSLAALFLVPRICALLSLVPFFGTLIPCLKEMTKDFMKFLVIVIILFFGFLTTFTMLARDKFQAREIWWTMINVFFGSSYLGFDIASQISPALGPTLMLCFVILTNILLLTSLIAILSNGLTKVMDHAREEYLFQYSVFVLEASASRRLTYFFPPLNLIALTLFRPLRLFLSGVELRRARIFLLKATHWPYVAAIWTFEGTKQFFSAGSDDESLFATRSRSYKQPLLGGRDNSTPRISRYPVVKNRSEASLSLKPSPREAHATRANDHEYAGELKQMKAMIEKLSMQETLASRLRAQESVLEKLSRQVEELTRRLAKPEDGQD